jgi:hypothetical protein
MTSTIAHPELRDRVAVIDTVTAVGVAADARDWAACRAAFTDTIFLDHDADATMPDAVSADEVITGWQRIWDGFSVTFHEVTNHQVDLDGDTARCRSYVRALHVAATTAAENTYTTFGHYDDDLVRTSHGWKITRRAYQQVFATGNAAVFRTV